MVVKNPNYELNIPISVDSFDERVKKFLDKAN